MIIKINGALLTCICTALSVMPGPTNCIAAEPIAFKEQTIDADIGKVCYAVITADVNGDDKPDVVAVSDSAVFWYENPSWKRHTIIADQTEKDNVCIAAHDIDGDGQIDFALGAGWTKIGTIQWLSRGESLDKPWNVHQIAVEPWTHRMRFADVLGTGKPQLVVSPLNKTQGGGVRLTAFSIPENPRNDRWTPTVLDQTLDKMHNHWHVQFDGKGDVDTLTASEEGVSLISKIGDEWKTEQLLKTAAGEIKTGQVNDSQRLIATIEPMHGTHAVAYIESGDQWNRVVLDETLAQGHAVWCADFDGDKTDEIVIGFRKPGTGEVDGPGLFLFRTNDEGKSWSRQIVDDGGIAVEDAVVADLNGDGKPDIIAGGRATRNVKVYWNEVE